MLDTPDPVETRSGFVHGFWDEVPLKLGKHPVNATQRHSGDSTVPPIDKEEWEQRQSGVIGQFNLTVPVTEVLEDYGYLNIGNRYLHPASTSGLPGCVINSATHAYAFSGGDPLSAQGVDRETGEVMTRNHDAFDCFRILFHEADQKRAIAAAVRVLKERAPGALEQARTELVKREFEEVPNAA
ncbi:MAG: hypothetical protein HN344_10555 [Gammaproteobacteria bacterium]|nr:hypothetical protein [Gammaproteobacteria bacterium]